MSNITLLLEFPFWDPDFFINDILDKFGVGCYLDEEDNDNNDTNNNNSNFKKPTKTKEKGRFSNKKKKIK
jgi:hypothetical protein